MTQEVPGCYRPKTYGGVEKEYRKEREKKYQVVRITESQRTLIVRKKIETTYFEDQKRRTLQEGDYQGDELSTSKKFGFYNDEESDERQRTGR